MVRTGLIVDDHENVVKSVVRGFPEYQWQTASNGREALNRVTDKSIDFVITDIRMPEMNGFDFLREVENLEKENLTNPYMAKIVLTGYDDQDTENDFGAYRVAKPWGAELEVAIKRALETASLKKDLSQQNHDVEISDSDTELIHTDKLITLGTMTASVAHELSNHLTIIGGFSEFLINKKLESEPARYAKVIQTSTNRCVEVVSNILKFSKKCQPQVEEANLHEILDQSIDLVSYGFRHHRINLVRQFYANQPVLDVDAQKMMQIFTNIIRNAYQIMISENCGNCLKITTQEKEGQLIIQFADNGPGIPESILSQLFDPFFSTKKNGEGIGLGMSIALNNIRQHGGTLMAENSQDRGAIFTAILPLKKL